MSIWGIYACVCSLQLHAQQHPEEMMDWPSFALQTHWSGNKYGLTTNKVAHDTKKTSPEHRNNCAQPPAPAITPTNTLPVKLPQDCKFDKIWPSNCIFPKQRRKIRCTSSGGSSKIVWRGPGFCRTSVATDVSMDNLRRAITPRYPLKLLLTRSHNTRWCYKKIVNLWARMPLRLQKTCTGAKTQAD